MYSSVVIERIMTGEVAKVHVLDFKHSVVVSQSYLRGRFGLVGDDFIVDLRRQGIETVMDFSFEGTDETWELLLGEHYFVHCLSDRRHAPLEDKKRKGKMVHSPT